MVGLDLQLEENILVVDPTSVMLGLAKRTGTAISLVEPVVLEEDAARLRLLKSLRRGVPAALWVRQP